MLNKKALLVVVFSFATSACPLLYCQANGSFSGTVSDKAGAVVSGATVKVTSQGTGVSREAKTNDSGYYLVPLLPVAFYTIRVESPGFQAAEQKDIRLQVDEHRELDFALVPASVSTAVQVNATEVAVETTNPSLGQVITSEEVADLPLNGRNFVQLATLTPGTTASTSPVSFFNGAASSEASTRGSFSLSVGGSREQSTDWLLDGNDNNQIDEGGIAIFSSIDDIQEFKVLTYTYSAEYGERAGPTVLVTTKSGSNQFHGSLFEFFRNTKLDASTPFVDATPQYNLNQFGGSFGGPIQKDKTFFFADYAAKMQRKGVPFTGVVPSTAMITPDANGDFNFNLDPFGNPRGTTSFPNLTNPFNGFVPFECDAAGNAIVPVNGVQTGGTPCNVIPAAFVNPVGLAALSLYPAPNANNATLDFNYALVPDRKLNEATWDIRFDHNFSSKDSVFARFSYDQATNFVPGGSPGFAEATSFGSSQFIQNHGRNLALSETHIVSPNTINQFNAGFSRIFNHILSFGTGTCEAAIIGILGADLGSKCDSLTGYPASLNQATNDCEGCGMTAFSMSSYYSVGDRGYAPYQGGTNVYSVSDTLDLIRGKHEIRFGGVFRDNQMNVRNNAFQDGFISEIGDSTNDDIADTLIGGMGNFAAHDQTFDGATVGRRWKLVRPFVQDDWRVSSNLTVNLGLAWALVTPETEVENRQSNFDFETGVWYVPKGAPAVSGCTTCVASDGRVGVQFDKTAFEPRIGLAWKPLGSQSTVVRLGYAIYHDSAWNQGGQGLWQNPPYYAEVDPNVFALSFGSPVGSLSGGFLFPASQPQPASTLAVPGGFIYNAPVNPTAYTGTIQSQNLDFKQGVVQQFNFNIEHQLPQNVVLTVGYAGSRSHHILVSQVDENIASPAACGTAGYTLGCGIAAFPYAPFQFINSNNSIGNARYDSLQIKAETKSARHGLYALIGYTYARNFDSGMPDGLGTTVGALYWPLPGSQKLDWSLSQLNLNNTFTASILYDLPFGKGKRYGSNWSGATNTLLGHWQVNLIERAQSGFPLFVVDSSNADLAFGAPGDSGTFFNYDGFSLNRPDEVGDPSRGGPVAGNPGCAAPSQVHTLSNWFNPCAFMKAPSGELGTAARAPVYGPRFVNTDFSIIKDFPLSFREAMNLQFRAEFFNFLNHPQYFLAGLGDTGQQDINSPSSFGVINQTLNNSRDIQFALRLNF
ncbi:MAG TPA: carboxypeptidase-like regulatory domain-containing protein [Candidatus Sulfotelmatobacter sp.]|jgi:carboxypeptidase family protein|nr:carboxypeptidase-like regulatory domain-containing protein [Candidatus Sulfotelmatobacter sp.]